MAGMIMPEILTKPCLPKPEREGEEIHGERHSDSGRRSGHTRNCFRDIGGRRPWHAHGQEFRRGFGRDWRKTPNPRLSRYLATRLKTRRLAVAEDRQGAEPDAAGRHDFRSRQYRDGGLRDKARRL